MSGHIIFRVRRGRSKDPRFPGYPEWFLLIVGEDGNFTRLSPRYTELQELFEEIFVHEFINDRMRGRNPDFTRKRLMFDPKKLLDTAQTKFEKHWAEEEDLDPVYVECNTQITSEG